MRTRLQQGLTGSALVLLAAVTASQTLAQAYPQRPIRMIVGLPVGGSTDLLGRLLAAKLGERLGQQVVFENRPGASGIIGTDIVAKSQPDACTCGKRLKFNLLMHKATNDSTTAKLRFVHNEARFHSFRRRSRLPKLAARWS